MKSFRVLAAGAVVAVALTGLATAWLRDAALVPTEQAGPLVSAAHGLSNPSPLQEQLGVDLQEGPGQTPQLIDPHGSGEAYLDLLPASVSSSHQEGLDNAPVSESGPDNPCDRPTAPLPAPGTPGATEFWQAFREPLPRAVVWNPPGIKRVGLQAGHWRVEEVPAELNRLGPGTSGGGRAEWQVNLDLAQRAAALLREAGLEVEVLPATIPSGYQAHAFLAIHADGDEAGVLRGYKLARAGFSATPEADDHLVASLYASYGPATGLPRDDLHISRRMTAYYAFNSRRYCHAVAPGVPAAILEAGFLTNVIDRQVLLGRPDAAAQGIAEGLLRYLGGQVAISQ